MTKRQHVVQKRLLSNFSSKTKEKYVNQMIWLFNKENNNFKEISLKDAGLIKNFLSTDSDDNITKLEAECYPSIDRIALKGCVTCKLFNAKEIVENYIFLYRYISLQLHRTMLERNKLHELPFWNDKSFDSIREHHSSYFIPNSMDIPFIDFGFGRFSKDNRKKLANMYISFVDQISKIPLLYIDGIAGSIFDFTLPVVTTNKTKIPYIRNDIGLVPFFPLKSTTYNMSLQTGENVPLYSILAFPIAPNVCIHLCTIESIKKWTEKIPIDSGRGINLITNEEQSIKLTNKFLLNFAEKFVFSNQKIKEEFFS